MGTRPAKTLLSNVMCNATDESKCSRRGNEEPCQSCHFLRRSSQSEMACATHGDVIRSRPLPSSAALAASVGGVGKRDGGNGRMGEAGVAAFLLVQGLIGDRKKLVYREGGAAVALHDTEAQG